MERRWAMWCLRHIQRGLKVIYSQRTWRLHSSDEISELGLLYTSSSGLQGLLIGRRLPFRSPKHQSCWKCFAGMWERVLGQYGTRVRRHFVWWRYPSHSRADFGFRRLSFRDIPFQLPKRYCRGTSQRFFEHRNVDAWDFRLPPRYMSPAQFKSSSLRPVSMFALLQTHWERASPISEHYKQA